MCCRKKQQVSSRDTPVENKKPPEEDSKKAEAPETKRDDQISLKVDSTQQSTPSESNIAKERSVDKATPPVPTSSKLKQNKTEYWKEEDPLKAIEQLRSGTNAVDDAEFGFTDGAQGGLKLFAVDEEDKNKAFGETIEMKAQEKEHREALKRRRMEVEMTQSSVMRKIEAELRTRSHDV